jgi:molybdopterin converting factor small subunit
MSQISIRIPMPLRSHTNGAGAVQLDAPDVRAALLALGARHDGLLERVLGPDGELRSFVNVFVGKSNIRSLAGLATPLAEGDVIAIIPAVAGGSRRTRSCVRGRPP